MVQVESGRFPGMGLLVFHHGKAIFEETVGLMDLEAGKQFEKDTLIRLYSQTKPVTCAGTGVNAAGRR